MIKVRDTVFTTKLGDITQERVDIIVNAANSELLGGGGVDGAIHRVGGPSIIDECRKIRAAQGSCPPGSSVVTGAGRLHAKHVIHAVGPRWNGGTRGEAELLASAYRGSLHLAVEFEASTIAFPSISTGAYGYPFDEAAPIAIKTCLQFAEEVPGLAEIRFILFSAADLEGYERLLRALTHRAS